MNDFPELFRLSVAAKRFFPNGGITANSLRAEAKAGRLDIIRIANKDFVTKDALSALLERCKVCVDETRPASDCGSKPVVRRSGQSLTEKSALAQASLRRTLQALRKRSKTTSQTSTNQATNVVRIDS